MGLHWKATTGETNTTFVSKQSRFTSHTHSIDGLAFSFHAYPSRSPFSPTMKRPS